MSRQSLPRLHDATVDVLRLFVSQPAGSELYGLQVCEAIGRQSGTLYPILYRLEDAGILISREEESVPKGERRRARIYYALNPEKMEAVRLGLARATQRQAAQGAGLRPGLGGAMPGEGWA